MSMLCKSLTNKYMIMVKKNVNRQDYEKYDKTIYKKKKILYKV